MAKGRYKIIRKIADGGMAEIFLGTQHGVEGFERPVVLKRILAPLLADPKFRNVLIDEAHVAMSLNHSNVAQVLDLGHSKGRYYLVLEFVDGWDLNHVWNRTRAVGFELPMEIALYVLAEVCRALSFAHNKTKNGKPMGIVHRDVSPHNVLLSEQGEVKLTDFGIAKAMTRREKTGQGVIKGKLAFMSPEQASGSVIDARSDVFAVGTMLYLFATGRRPFEAPTDLEGILRVQRADFPPPEQIKPDLAGPLVALIKKAMMLRPSERFQNAEAMLVEIEALQRSVYQPAGQTELKRWLAELEKRDGVPAIGRARQAPMPASEEEIPELGDGDFQLEDSTSDATLAAPDGMTPAQMIGGLTRGVGPTLPAPAGIEAGTPPRAVPDDDASGPRLTSATVVERKGQTPAPPLLMPGDPPRAGTGSSIRVSMPPPPDVPPQEPSMARRWLMVGAAVAALGGVVYGLTKDRRRRPVATPVQPVPEPEPAAAPTPATTAPPEPEPAAAPDEPRSAATGDASANDAGSDANGDDDEEQLLQKAEADIQATVIGEKDDEAAEPPRPEARPGSKPAAAARPVARPAAPKAAPVVSVKIVSKPEGAVIRLKSRVFGRAPMTLRFKSGIKYELAFVKQGYVTANKTFTVTSRPNQTVTVALRKRPAAKKSEGLLDRLGRLLKR